MATLAQKRATIVLPVLPLRSVSAAHSLLLSPTLLSLCVCCPPALPHTHLHVLLALAVL